MKDHFCKSLCGRKASKRLQPSEILGEGAFKKVMRVLGHIYGLLLLLKIGLYSQSCQGTKGVLQNLNSRFKACILYPENCFGNKIWMGLIKRQWELGLMKFFKQGYYMRTEIHVY